MQREPEKRRDAYLLGTFASSVVAFPIFTGLILVARDLIPFAFGAQWIEAVPVVQAFSILGVLTAVGILQASLIRSQGQADIWLYYMLAKQAVTVLYIFLFSRWGIGALSLSLVALNIVMWLPTVDMVARLLDISIPAYLGSFTVPVAATLVMWGIGWLVQSSLADAEIWLRLVATIGAAAISYGAVVLLLGRSQLETLLGFVRRRR
jgi:O-antigen/teichoic acid export membrane protein